MASGHLEKTSIKKKLTGRNFFYDLKIRYWVNSGLKIIVPTDF